VSSPFLVLGDGRPDESVQAPAPVIIFICIALVAFLSVCLLKWDERVTIFKDRSGGWAYAARSTGSQCQVRHSAPYCAVQHMPFTQWRFCSQDV